MSYIIHYYNNSQGKGYNMVVNVSTGEIVSSKFAKLYLDDIEKLKDLTMGEHYLLLLIVKTMKFGENNEVLLSPKRKKILMPQVGVTTTNSISNMLRKMVAKGVLKKESDDDYTYFVNPRIYFKGNDYNYVETVEKYDNISGVYQVFKNKKEMEEALNKQEDDELSA